MKGLLCSMAGKFTANIWYSNTALRALAKNPELLFFGFDLKVISN